MAKFRNNDSRGYTEAEVIAIAGTVESDVSDAVYTWYIVTQKVAAYSYAEKRDIDHYFWATAVRDPNGSYRTIGSYGIKASRQEVIDMCRDSGYAILA